MFVSQNRVSKLYCTWSSTHTRILSHTDSIICSVSPGPIHTLPGRSHCWNGMPHQLCALTLEALRLFESSSNLYSIFTLYYCSCLNKFTHNWTHISAEKLKHSKPAASVVSSCLVLGHWCYRQTPSSPAAFLLSTHYSTAASPPMISHTDQIMGGSRTQKRTRSPRTQQQLSIDKSGVGVRPNVSTWMWAESRSRYLNRC